MKTIKINESQRKRIFEAYSEGFSFENLTVIGKGQFAGEDHSKEQYEYCRKYLGEPDGLGTSRAVFTLSDNTVLKLAYGRADIGKMQNRGEEELFTKTHSPLLARVYAADKVNYTWLVSEMVLPIEEEDFEKILGIPLTGYYHQNSEPRFTRGGKGHMKVGYNKYFDNPKKFGESYYKEIGMEDVLKYITNRYSKGINIQDPDMINILYGKNSKWFGELIKLAEGGYFKKPGEKEDNSMIKKDIDNNLADLRNINNYGIVNRDGKELIVLLDSGSTMKITRNYY